MKTKGALLSRKKGKLKTKGEYIIVIDPDNILINNILIKAYTVQLLKNMI